MKYLLRLAIPLLMFSCQDTSQSGKSTKTKFEDPVSLDLEEIKERGYITAIIDNSSTGLFLYKGKTMGYEYDLLMLYAEKIGVDLRMNITPSLEEGFEKLNNGEGDILAYNLTVTKERKNRVAFTDYHNLVKSVLIQRKPDNWRQMKLHEIEKTLIRNPIELIDKEVHVRHSSSFVERLQNLSEEIGGDILIVEADPIMETEGLIRQVAEGEIDFTVADEDVAKVNSKYYSNIDVETAVSFDQQIAWGVRKNAPDLLQSLNNWIGEMKRTADYYVIYDKYFNSSRAAVMRSRSDYFSLNSGELSPYDDLIKKYAKTLGWDWRLLAAQIYKESKFQRHAKSWAGAVGLMQLLPVTAAEYGVEDLNDAEDNIKAGTSHIQWLQNYFSDKILDSLERQKFILAGYNVGHGHVMDAIRLTEKHGKNPQLWADVSEFLLKKSNSNYFNDPVVEYGYCRGIEPVQYVEVIYTTYENYKALLAEDAQAVTQNTLP